MTERDLILGLLTKTLNKTDEELIGLLFEKSNEGSETLKDEALTVSLDLVEKKIGKLKSTVNEKELRDSISKRVKGETMSDFEKELKEKYELESDKAGQELIDEIVNKYKVNDSEFTPDKVKLTDTYRNREKELTKQIKDLRKEFDTEKETLVKDFGKKETWNVIARDIRKKLIETDPVLPKNKKAADNLVDLFVGSFSEYEWQADGDGNHFPTKDGKRIEDKLGNEISFSSLVSDRINEYFDIPVQDKKGGAGNEGGGTPKDVPVAFKDDAEYLKYIDNEPDLNKRIAAKKVFQSQSR